MLSLDIGHDWTGLNWLGSHTNTALGFLMTYSTSCMKYVHFTSRFILCISNTLNQVMSQVISQKNFMETNSTQAQWTSLYFNVHTYCTNVICIVIYV